MINFKVLQVNPNKQAKAREQGLSYMFVSMNEHKRFDTKPEKNMYDYVYEGHVLVDKKPCEICEDLFAISNAYKIEGWKGHSMSVSDIVEIEGDFYYCDDIGFVKLEDF